MSKRCYMKKIIVTKLEQEHTVVRVFASDLDEHNDWIQTERQKEINFEKWNIFHQIILWMKLCKDKAKYIYWYYASDLDAKTRKRVRSCIKLAEPLPELLMIEQKKKLEIHFWKFLVFLYGKFDGVYVKWDKYIVVDVKTSARKRDADKAEKSIQLKCYAMLNRATDIEWWIFTKQAKPELQVIKLTVDYRDAHSTVINSIKNYLVNNYWYND